MSTLQFIDANNLIILPNFPLNHHNIKPPCNFLREGILFLVVLGDEQQCLKNELHIVELEEDFKKANEELNSVKVWYCQWFVFMFYMSVLI